MPHIPRQYPWGTSHQSVRHASDTRKSRPRVKMIETLSMLDYDRDPAEIAEHLFGKEVESDGYTGGLVRPSR